MDTRHPVAENTAMLALLLTLLAAPMPFYASSKLDACDQVVCPFTANGRVCYCAPAVINLGVWDPRKGPLEWPDNADVEAPKAWGEYATEKAN